MLCRARPIAEQAQHVGAGLPRDRAGIDPRYSAICNLRAWVYT